MSTPQGGACPGPGVVAARAGGGDELLMADVDLARAADSHARRLFMKHRRPELYSGFVVGKGGSASLSQ